MADIGRGDVVTDPSRECSVCGRRDAPLRTYVDARGHERIACLDEHACLAEYTRRRRTGAGTHG